ncbi:MAG: bifunctional serine/threonine-protein kinase/formylglycine-generating enzyme family protein [Candidatus Competibacter sp.]
MDRATHCPNCFQEPAPAPHCSHCGFDAASYLETNEILPLFTALAAGKYLVGRVLGEGGFGVVYAGLAQRLKRPVAIKEFFPAVDNPLAQRQGVTVTARPRYQDAFANWKDQFLREAELLAQFNHPRIVQVHDIVEENNTVYLIMERLEGQTLSEHLGGLHLQGEVLKAARHLSPDDGRRLLDAALEALDVLHGHVPPVLHRDLTPHNLLLVDNRIERLKVLDFGLARLGERTQSVVSLAVRVGNPGFAAPEQLGLYPGAITPATDFYTLGATLYAALAGVAPPNAQQRCTEQPPQSPPLLPELDPILAQVIRACLEMSPQKRPHSVADIRQRLAAGTIILPLDELSPLPPLPSPPQPLLVPEPENNPQVELLLAPAQSNSSDHRSQSFTRGYRVPPVLTQPSAPSPPESAPVPVSGGQLRTDRRSSLWKKTLATLVLIVGVLAYIVVGLYPVYKGVWYEKVWGKLTFVEPEMVRITGGCFQMGSPRSESGWSQDARQHRVCVKDFEIGKYEVTQGQWRMVMGDNPSYFLSFFENTDSYPVEWVSWTDVQAYLNNLSRETGKQYRLPTEAEWEYACRGGKVGESYCGGNDADQVAWSWRNSSHKPHPVGLKAANSFGLYDMTGNVCEWTCSTYDKDYGGAEQRCFNNDTADHHVWRGGSWYVQSDSDVWTRSFAKSWDVLPYRSSFVGFRLARSL